MYAIFNCFFFKSSYITYDLLHQIHVIFGGIWYYVFSIEFQKRRLPHAHIIVKVSSMNLHLNINSFFFDLTHLASINYVIQAEIPSYNQNLHNLVLQFMTHHKDHLDPFHARTSQCNCNGHCIYGYPHNIVSHTRLNEKQHVKYWHWRADDAWIVPYCPQLLLIWEGHINTEIIFPTDVFLYIYKYIFKGVDQAKFSITYSWKSNKGCNWWSYSRSMASSPETAYYIFAFDIAWQNPSVTCLKIHAPGENHCQYQFSLWVTSHASSLICYFNCPMDSIFDNIPFINFYQQYHHWPLPPSSIHLSPNVKYNQFGLEWAKSFIFVHYSCIIQLALLLSFKPFMVLSTILSNMLHKQLDSSTMNPKVSGQWKMPFLSEYDLVLNSALLQTSPKPFCVLWCIT